MNPTRRTFLRASGAMMALPFLEVFGKEPATPRRILAICTNLGVLERHFFPEQAGRDYALTPYLEALKDHRDQFTVFSQRCPISAPRRSPAPHRSATASRSINSLPSESVISRACLRCRS
jgi:hypothetical protein